MAAEGVLAAEGMVAEGVAAEGVAAEGVAAEGVVTAGVGASGVVVGAPGIEVDSGLGPCVEEPTDSVTSGVDTVSEASVETD